jgi:hypothetical protein
MQWTGTLVCCKVSKATWLVRSAVHVLLGKKQQRYIQWGASVDRTVAYLQVHHGRLHCSKRLLEDLEGKGLGGDVEGVLLQTV